jgi:hypothetical protein
MANHREVQNGKAQQSTGRAIEVKSLIIAAVAAAVAAIVTSIFWQRGALISTALTPVIVALVQEALRRPAERISSTASRVAVAPLRAGALAGAGAGRDPAAPRFQPRRLAERERGPVRGVPAGAPGSGTTATQPAGNGANGAGATHPRRPGANGAGADLAVGERPAGPTVYRQKRFRWKVVIATASAAFLIAAGALTISELALGGPVVADGKTTLFGGGDGGDGSESTGDDESSDDATSDPSQSEDAEATAEGDSSESSVPPEEDPAAEEPAPEEPAPEEPPTEPVPSEEQLTPE